MYEKEKIRLSLLKLSTEKFVKLWNKYIADEDNGALHYGLHFYKMTEFDLMVKDNNLTNLEVAKAVRESDECLDFYDDYVAYCDEIDNETFFSFTEHNVEKQFPIEFVEELAEFIAEHEQAIKDDRTTEQEILKAFETSFADKYLEVFGIDVFVQGLCPMSCGFILSGCGKRTCESCRSTFWNSPYEREYNLKH